MAGLTLYEITGVYQDLMEAIEAGNELDAEATQAIIRQVEDMLTRKSTGVIGFYRNMQNIVESATAEIERLKAIKQYAERQRDRHVNYVKMVMDAREITEITTEIGRLKIKKNPDSVDVVSVSDVPEDFTKSTLTITGSRPAIRQIIEDIKMLNLDVMYTETVQAEKKQIHDHFKATGEILPGIRMVLDKTRLEIK